MSNAEHGIAGPEDLATAFADCWNRHDTAAMARLFLDDAHMVNVVGIWWKSAAEIEEAHVGLHAGPFRDSHLEMETPTTRPVAPGVVVVHTPWRLTGQRRPDGTPDGERRGVMLFVAVEGPTGWRIHTAQNTDIVPGVVVPPASEPQA